jgi:hypothetical protein
MTVAINQLLLALSILTTTAKYTTALCTTSKCYIEPHEYYEDKRICKSVFIGEHPGVHKVFNLTCDWAKFLDAEAQAPVFTEEADKTLILYLITFELSSTFNKADPKYTHLDKGFLKRFRVRSLTMRNLSLISVNDSAFNKESFGIHFRALDLSSNSLSRLDAHMLEHMDQMDTLNLSNNKLTFGESNFIYNPKLKKLDLSNNKIRVLAANIFLNLDRLEVIDLKGKVKLNNTGQGEKCSFLILKCKLNHETRF